jgi:hypothetical protein
LYDLFEVFMVLFGFILLAACLVFGGVLYCSEQQGNRRFPKASNPRRRRMIPAAGDNDKAHF